MLSLGSSREALLVGNQLPSLLSLLSCSLMRDDRRTAVSCLQLLNVVLHGPNRGTPCSNQLNCTPCSSPMLSLYSARPSSKDSRPISRPVSTRMIPRRPSSYCSPSSSTTSFSLFPARGNDRLIKASGPAHLRRRQAQRQPQRGHPRVLRERSAVVGAKHHGPDVREIIGGGKIPAERGRYAQLQDQHPPLLAEIPQPHLLRRRLRRTSTSTNTQKTLECTPLFL